MKTMRRLYILVLLLCLLAGCGGGYAGTWRCAYMDTGRSVLTAGDLNAAGTELYIKLNAGGSGTMTADGEAQRITWTQAADKSALLLTVNGQQEQFAIDGEGLIWVMGDVTVTFLPENSGGYKTALEKHS